MRLLGGLAEHGLCVAVLDLVGDEPGAQLRAVVQAGAPQVEVRERARWVARHLHALALVADVADAPLPGVAERTTDAVLVGVQDRDVARLDLPGVRVAVEVRQRGPRGDVRVLALAGSGQQIDLELGLRGGQRRLPGLLLCPSLLRGLVPWLVQLPGPVAERVEVPLSDDLVQEAQLRRAVEPDLLPDQRASAPEVARSAPADLLVARLTLLRPVTMQPGGLLGVRDPPRAATEAHPAPTGHQNGLARRIQGLASTLRALSAVLGHPRVRSERDVRLREGRNRHRGEPSSAHSVEPGHSGALGALAVQCGAVPVHRNAEPTEELDQVHQLRRLRRRHQQALPMDQVVLAHQSVHGAHHDGAVVLPGVALLPPERQPERSGGHRALREAPVVPGLKLLRGQHAVNRYRSRHRVQKLEARLGLYGVLVLLRCLVSGNSLINRAEDQRPVHRGDQLGAQSRRSL